MGVPASLDKNMMGFSIHTVSSWTWGFLQISFFAKQWLILELFSHFIMPLAVHQGSYSMGKLTFIFCPWVRLSGSLTKTTEAANAWRHGSHAVSSCLDRFETSSCHGPTVCVRTPSVVWLFSYTQRLKSRVTSGSPNAGALVKNLFTYLKAFSCSGPHTRGFLPDPPVSLNNGLSISEKPSIQIWQSMAALMNS